MRGLARRALGGSERAPDLSSASPGFLGGDLEVLRGTRRTTARLQALSSPLAGLAPVTLTSLLVPYLSPSWSLDSLPLYLSIDSVSTWGSSHASLKCIGSSKDERSHLGLDCLCTCSCHRSTWTWQWVNGDVHDMLHISCLVERKCKPFVCQFVTELKPWIWFMASQTRACSMIYVLVHKLVPLGMRL